MICDKTSAEQKLRSGMLLLKKPSSREEEVIRIGFTDTFMALWLTKLELQRRQPTCKVAYGSAWK